MLDQVKASQIPLTMAGDGRHESMGHSAKYCAYTMFCCNTNSIIHFSIVQVRKHVMLKQTKLTENISISIHLLQRNVADSSQAMEFLAFQNCMDYLSGKDVLFNILITDRHTQIAKHMRENLGHITHYFDLWHLRKSKNIQ